MLGYSDKLKIVFAGSVGSGKTTAIESISDTEAFKTEESATDEVKNIKETTTVALDFGQMKLANGESVNLYGTPGQKRFDFMWEILAEGAIGVIIVINSTLETCQEELDDYLKVFTKILAAQNIIVVVTHTDLWEGTPFSQLREQVELFDHNIPVFSMDARSRLEVGNTVKALLYHIDSELAA